MADDKNVNTLTESARTDTEASRNVVDLDREVMEQGSFVTYLDNIGDDPAFQDLLASTGVTDQVDIGYDGNDASDLIVTELDADQKTTAYDNKPEQPENKPLSYRAVFNVTKDGLKRVTEDRINTAKTKMVDGVALAQLGAATGAKMVSSFTVEQKNAAKSYVNAELALAEERVDKMKSVVTKEMAEAQASVAKARDTIKTGIAATKERVGKAKERMGNFFGKLKGKFSKESLFGETGATRLNVNIETEKGLEPIYSQEKQNEYNSNRDEAQASMADQLTALIDAGEIEDEVFYEDEQSTLDNIELAGYNPMTRNSTRNKRMAIYLDDIHEKTTQKGHTVYMAPVHMAFDQPGADNIQPRSGLVTKTGKSEPIPMIPISQATMLQIQELNKDHAEKGSEYLTFNGSLKLSEDSNPLIDARSLKAEKAPFEADDHIQAINKEKNRLAILAQQKEEAKQKKQEQKEFEEVDNGIER